MNASRRVTRRLASALVLALAACVAPLPHDPGLQPEAATAPVARSLQHFEQEAVVAAHPLAAEAGARILREGGSALDAAISAQLVLGLVEPQSSGIGGGAFLLHWDGRRVRAYDGRETAPAAVDESLFLDAQGAPLAFAAAATGGRSVGVPGTLRMLELAHRAHGRLPWRRLFEPAITLAEHGFPVSARLHALLQGDAALRTDDRARTLFYRADGSALPVGSRGRNPEYAAVLREIADGGASVLHEGVVAAAIVAAVRGHHANPGRLSAGDLAGYRALERAPLCFDWRRWQVCGMPPPAAGALVVGQILGLLERVAGAEPAGPRGRPDADFLHRYSEAARLAGADRDRYIADPAFAAAPGGGWLSLLAPEYLKLRAAMIGPAAMREAVPGDPAGLAGRATCGACAGASAALPATSHVSVVDARGQAVALTSSIEAQFGARVMVNRGLGLAGGFLLNNQLTDFSFAPRDRAGLLSVNRVQPGKRPRSNMAPTLIFERPPGAADSGMRLVAVLGSAGGTVIPQYVAGTLWAALAQGLDAQQAVALPHVIALADATLLEPGALDAPGRRALQARGHRLRERPLTSGTQLLLRKPARGWQAGADPRREGRAAGR